MKRQTYALFRRWHRRAGIASALFVILLATTGLLLLASGPLGLDQKQWGGAFIAKIYNQTPKSEPTGIALGDDQWVVLVDDLLYIGGADPVTLTPPLRLAAKDQRYILVANDDETIIAMADGRLVERLQGVNFTGQSPAPIPDNIRASILKRYRGQGMPVSRILLDIHTGRFFGKIGTWLMATASILFLMLSLSGLYMWLKKPNGNRTKSA